MQRKSKTIYKESDEKIQVVDLETGEITQEHQKHVEKSYTDAEPDYIKLYLDTVLTFKGISKALNPVLVSLCKHMSYADKDQIVYVNKYVKTCIEKDTGLKVKRIEQAIKEFKNVGILMQVSRGVYRVNPNIIGRGLWTDIKRLRATFDFVTGDVQADIIASVDNQVAINNDKAV